MIGEAGGLHEDSGSTITEDNQVHNNKLIRSITKLDKKKFLDMEIWIFGIVDNTNGAQQEVVTVMSIPR